MFALLTVLIVILSFVLYLVAYHTYGRFLSKRIFRIDPDRVTPAHELNDGVDFVPSARSLVFGHHFTSIAGTGPIVGPAIAVVWGWVPALVWVLVGSIFMGAVHDFGSLIVSMRHRGRTIADLSGTVVNGRVRVLFMVVCLIGLWIVLAIFGLVIATIFKLYPSSVIPVFVQIPIAVGLGVWLRRGLPMVMGSLIAVGLMYASVWWAAWSGVGIEFPASMTHVLSEIGWWTLILMVYVFIASVLPVHVLLQPRDFINSWQLLVAMGLLVAGVFVARPEIVADGVRLVPEVSSRGNPAPPMMPFLFITVACGAVSGFHCLVSSGCSSRQLKSESDAQYIGYGAMLTEGFLAILVIIACVAGIGMGASDGHAVWMGYYRQWGGDGGLGDKLTPFIEGSASMLGSVGMGRSMAITLMGVFVASFAATTLDSATRLQRYIIAELAGSGGQRASGLGRLRAVCRGRYGATFIAVVSALVFALSDAVRFGHGTGGVRIDFASAGLGGLTLWPIFGATNQLLASLALLVITVWLVKSRRPAWVTAVPMVFMLAMTSYAIVLLARGFADAHNPLLLGISVLMFVLQVWIMVEGVVLMGRHQRRPITVDG